MRATGSGGAGRYRREQIRTRVANGGARRPELRLGLRNCLIGNGDLLLERVQERVLKRLPPLRAEDIVARLRDLPLGGERAVQRRVFLEH